MKTTMNAVLNAEEEERVTRAWLELRLVHNKLECTDDIPEMLWHATALITAAHDLRRAIADACYYAEQRAFGPRLRPTHKVVPGPWDRAQRLNALGITPADIENFLATRKDTT